MGDLEVSVPERSGGSIVRFGGAYLKTSLNIYLHLSGTDTSSFTATTTAKRWCNLHLFYPIAYRSVVTTSPSIHSEVRGYQDEEALSPNEK